MQKHLVIFSLGTLLASSSVSARPAPGEPVDPDTAHWYQSLRQPQTKGSCCDMADCRPTELRQMKTEWQAYISKELYGASAPDDWVTIPEDHILQHVNNPTGRVVICWYNHQIYCAVLPTLF